MKNHLMPGEEWWDILTHPAVIGQWFQYDYRTVGGRLFSCVIRLHKEHYDPDPLIEARRKRDEWLQKLREAI